MARMWISLISLSVTFLFQFLKEGHLRWDSLGEYLATAIGFQVSILRSKYLYL